MAKLDPASDIKTFLANYSFKPNDLLGQNFLINFDILEQILVAADIREDEQVLEIGPGIGNLTVLLAEHAKFVLAIEKDQRYLPILKKILGRFLISEDKAGAALPKQPEANVRLAFEDALSFNFQELLQPGYKVVANIPYYITGYLIEMLLAAKNKPKRIVLMVQKEVAQRMAAKPGALSVLGIATQLYSNPKLVSLVPKENFYPQPKVDSALIVLDVLDQPRFKVDDKKLFGLVRALFAGKRKQIHNTLKNNMHVPDQTLTELFKKGIIKSEARPQELDLEQWHKLYVYLADQDLL